MPGILYQNQSPESWSGEPQLDKINQAAWLKVVESMLAEKDDEEEVIKEGFIWRAIFLYNQEIGAKMDQDEMRRFYEKIKPELIKIFNLKQREYEFDKMPIKKGDSEKHNRGWYAEWEEKQR
jgi:hypothetical protein